MKESVSFRSKALYNNNMYSLAGSVAETLGGQSFEKLVKEELLRPLGMKHTGFLNNLGHQAKNQATQYAYNLNKSRFRINRERYG